MMAKKYYSDYKQMTEDCWLFLTDDSMPEVATIKKAAFIHEVRLMIETAVMYVKLQEKNKE